MLPTSHRDADRHAGSDGNGSRKTKIRKHRAVSAPVATANADCCQPDSNLETFRPVCGSETSYNTGQTLADKDVDKYEVLSVASRRIPDCGNIEVNSQAVSNLPQVNIDKAVSAESDVCSARTSEHFLRFNHVDNTAGVEPVESKWQNFNGDRAPDHDSIHCRSPYQSPSVHEYGNACTSPVGETLSICNTADARGSETIGRKRRISEARSALYRRLLSSETAGSSDDSFDLQSLPTSDDEDSNLSLDSNQSRLVIISISFALKMLMLQLSEVNLLL